MQFSIFLSALRARSRTFFWIVAATVMTALVASLLMSKSYVAKASIVADGKLEQSLLPGTPMYTRDTGHLQTQVDILTSPTVARRVVKDLRLFDEPALAEAFRKAAPPGAIDDWIGELLLKSLKVSTSQSSIIQVSYTADDPVFAARIANGFASAYVDNVLELRVEPLKKASAWFDDQLKSLRDNMDAAQQRLAEFQRQHGILAADERNDLESIQLTELATQAARTREPARAAYADTVLAERDNRSIQNLKAGLSMSRARLQQLSSEFGGRHPQVIRQNAEVAALDEQLQNELRAAAAGAAQLAQAERQRGNRLRADVESQRARVGDQREARTRLALLSNDFANAQRTYDLAMQRAMASKIDSRALLPNVSVLSEATPPSSPQRPQVALNLMLALALGTLMGLAAVHFMEMSDRRLRVIDDLDDDPRLPLLAVLNAHDPGTQRLLGITGPGGNAFPRSLPGPG